MGLSIKNDTVETMIRTLAERRGVSMTEAVRQVVAAELGISLKHVRCTATDTSKVANTSATAASAGTCSLSYQ